MRDAIISFPWIGLEINPSASCFSIMGKPIYWYGLLIGLGFLLAVFYVLHRTKRFGFNPETILDMLIFAVPAAIIGARLYYVAFNWSHYAKNPISILWIWEGGLAIYGGIIGGAAAAAVYCRIKKYSAGAMLDLGGLGLLIGQGIGRWGNFFNREAFGRVTSVPWKMGLSQFGREAVYYHPTFLYEFLWNLAGFILLHIFSKKRRKYNGQIFLMYITWYGFGRFLIEGLRTDSLYLLNTGIRVSQLVAALSVLVGAALLIANHFRGPKPLLETVSEDEASQPEKEAEKSLENDGEPTENTDGKDKSEDGDNH